jgi:hypothetical protein
MGENYCHAPPTSMKNLVTLSTLRNQVGQLVAAKALIWCRPS